ncbi:hydroxyphenylacetyl-CoA thioesterase PaaI [Coralliovum pocilloporae]|uniref:hydroxyphenylacetyl-CoA thioesterase PaaI n=1 Tax=Coralliovum pocilloporae TaxID=3066369 RepID=UPI00330794A5
MAQTADELAKACAAALWQTDQASQSMGMQLDAVSPGKACVSMLVTDVMVNGHGTCHGGVIFTLADSAFAFACNSYNQRTVAQHCSVTFLTPAYLGDRLVAEATERQRQGRSGIYDIVVRTEKDMTIAEFRGHCRTVKGTLLPPEDVASEATEEDC